MTCSHEWCAPGIRPQIDDLRDLAVDRYPWLPEIAHSRQAAWVTQDDIAQLSPEEQRMIRDGEIQSMLAIPMFGTGQMRGILGLDDVQVRKRWSDFEQRLLRLVADIISAALVRDQLQRALHAMAYQDALTGLQNRRAFDERLRAEILRARRYREVFSLLLLDIDRFNLDPAVERPLECVPRGVRQGATRRRSGSTTTSCNAVGRRAGRAPGVVAAITRQVSHRMNAIVNAFKVLHKHEAVNCRI